MQTVLQGTLSQRDWMVLFASSIMAQCLTLELDVLPMILTSRRTGDQLLPQAQRTRPAYHRRLWHGQTGRATATRF